MNESASADPARRPALPAVAAIFVLFIATGMSGLIYQVVWQRYLLNIFGATIYSVSTVLSAFMGGLALGSYLFGRLADRSRRPLVVYGALEIGIGVLALAVPLMLKVLDPLFTGVYRSFESSFYLYSAIRFAVVFAILLLPTTMMGGTFPVLSRFLSPRGGAAGLRVGLLYAVNTAGAVLGTLLSGFYFIRWWGISRTVLFAAAVNIGAGLLAIALSRAFPVGTAGTAQATVPAPRTDPESRRRIRLVFLAFAVSGFAALALEVAWTRSLVFTFDLLKNTTYSFTAMLATYLVGVALGSAVMTPFVERQREPYRVYAALQVLIGLASVASFFVLYYPAYTLGGNWFHELGGVAGDIRWNAALALIFLRTGAVMFVPTFCMGLAFPVAVRVVAENSPTVGRDVGRLYAVNTLGAILGAAVAGFILLPALGIAATIVLLGALQLATGAILAGADRGSSAVQRWGYAVLGIAAVTIAVARMPKPARFQPENIFERTVFYKEGPFATVAVGENSLGFRTIYVDNVGVAGTDPMLLTDQKSLAHVPMLLLKYPKSALTVGFGSGGASYSYTLYPELERIDCVEITRTVPEAAPTLTASNRDIIMHAPEYEERTGSPPKGEPLWNDGGASGWYKADPRYRIVLDDARSHLRFTGIKYDIIATDCTDLRYKSNANLYDLEYFRLCRQHITDDGMVVVWMPLAGLSDEAYRVALRTFHTVFPEMLVFYMNNQPTHYCLLIGTKTQLKVDAKQLAERIARPGVAKDLAELHLDNPVKILSCFIMAGRKCAEYLGDGPLNTEDFPYLEFESPRYGYSDEPLLDNLENMLKHREPPQQLLAEGAPAEFTAALKRYYDAVPAVIRGHHHYRKLEIMGSAEAYLEALLATPDDTAVRGLLDFDELKRKVQGQPGSLWAKWELGRVLALQKRDAEAAAVLNELVDQVKLGRPVNDTNPREFARLALDKLAEVYERTGRTEAAKSYREQAAAMARGAAGQ